MLTADIPGQTVGLQGILWTLLNVDRVLFILKGPGLAVADSVCCK